MPEWRYGADRISVVLRDGRTYSPVEVAWGREIISVEGSRTVPFNGEEILDVVDLGVTRNCRSATL